MIGVIGGVGPYAGLDLVAKILDHTRARNDQEHLPLVHLSIPGKITDRTEFLQGQTKQNPGPELARLSQLAISAGARVIGIPCNTAHVPIIFNHVLQSIEAAEEKVLLVSMIAEVIKALQKHELPLKTVGVLSTNGTYQAQLYKQAMEQAGFTVVRPNEGIQTEVVHPAIYAPYGIKACSNPPTERAVSDIKYAVRHLIGKGAEAIILACTEIPLVFPQQDHFQNIPLIDSTEILAKALIRHVCPHKLQ